jgi:molybdopterin biosynthesis enzyme MoaB
MVEPLFQRPVSGRVETFRGIGSHLIVPSGLMVRAGSALRERTRPAFFSKERY